MQVINDKLKVWANDLDQATLAQAERTARLPIVTGHVALMPDAHLGLGATIGSVVPTEGAVIPACVGVDLGCGMIAVHTDLDAGDLPDNLDPLLGQIEKAIPAGVGRGHKVREADAWLDGHRPRTDITGRLEQKAYAQMGTLGSGNHFAEISLDEHNEVWLVIHSGSRGIGNLLAQSHITKAKAVAARLSLGLEDPNLAYLLEGTTEFDHYIADLRFAQAYALQNRETMMDAILDIVLRFVGKGRELDRVNCHHNYTEQETHQGRTLWITRKGAISARNGEKGILPGSMGTDTYIVSGLGNPESYRSSAHGAGRRMSRTQARKQLTTRSLREAMQGRTWLSARAKALVDEHPDAYKDVREVIRLSADLVTVDHRLRAVLNYKGT
ncbi:MAG: RtcB family protein [Acidimicrobiia bacterium]